MALEEESYQKQWQIQKLTHVHDTCQLRGLNHVVSYSPRAILVKTCPLE